MKYYSRNGFNVRQYINVVLAMGFLTLLEKELVFLRKDLIGAPYLLILTIACLFGDYFSGILATILGVLFIGFVSQTGGHLDPVTIRRSIEFLVAGTTIFILSFHSRKLSLSHLGLSETLKQLDLVTNDLNNELISKKKDVRKLKKLNSDLRSVIDDIMEDKELWSDSVEQGVKKQNSKRKKLDNNTSSRS